ncbi:hypothetical protein D3218_08725 [Aureimonas flava]|uniref:SH3 domain-containing protein n=1 Tax=Aureimonas flava TaxID=2320271 RepID=A0A3A1WM17_9HYPH|nr:hypothetical protein [Aureimonas flava]RIY01428.1 hypothetical protein D3218_08725 [Aureimonas flava]
MTVRLSLPTLAALLLAFAHPAGASKPLSGSYGPLALAVGDDGSVHGVFAERRVGNGSVDAPQFSCLFLLEGRLEGDSADVDTWVPGEVDRIGGELRLGAEPTLRLEENHGGCLMTTGDMRDAPYDLLLDEPRADWIGAGLVTAERAILRPSPSDAPGSRRPYLVRFDPVAVLARRPGWIHVEYLEAAGGRVTGWLREADVTLSAARRR